MKYVLITIISIFVLFQNGEATEAPYPPVNRTSINGIWEGTSGYDFFRLDFTSKSIPCLAHATRTQKSLAFWLSNINFKSGYVNMEFKGHGFMFKIRGKGVANWHAEPQEGVINATIDRYASSTSEFQRTWDVTLHKGEYIKIFYDLSNSAQEAIQRQIN